MSTAGVARWVVRHHQLADPAIRLFCVPYAGAGPPVFQTWSEDLPQSVEVCAIALPGRGRRFGEPAYRAMPELVASLVDGITPLLDRPYALFGHSMGAYVAFELARALRDHAARPPLHLAVSGAGAPQLPRHSPLHGLPEHRFVEEVRALNGFAPEVLREPQLMELLLPVLRADFALAETYVCGDLAPLTCAMSVFGGSDDPLVHSDRLLPWAAHTTGTCTCHVLAGDHFFVHSGRAELLRLLAEDLSAAVQPAEAMR